MRPKMTVKQFTNFPCTQKMEENSVKSKLKKNFNNSMKAAAIMIPSQILQLGQVNYHQFWLSIASKSRSGQYLADIHSATDRLYIGKACSSWGRRARRLRKALFQWWCHKQASLSQDALSRLPKLLASASAYSAIGGEHYKQQSNINGRSAVKVKVCPKKFNFKVVKVANTGHYPRAQG